MNTGRVAQYVCPTHLTRVYPFSGYEKELATVAPIDGATGEVLLSSLNASRRAKGLKPFAWCFTCNHWVEARAESAASVARRFFERPGLSYRLAAGIRSRRLQELRANEKARRRSA